MLLGLLHKVAVKNANDSLKDSATKLFSGDAFKRDEQGNAPAPIVKGGDFAERHPKLREIGMGAAASLAGAKTLQGESGERIFQAGKSAKEGVNGLQMAITDGLAKNGNSITAMLKDETFLESAKESLGMAQKQPQESLPGEDLSRSMPMTPKP